MTRRRREARPPERASAQSVPPAVSLPFELRYTADASAEIKSLDGSIKKQLRKVLEKKLAIDPEGYGLPLRGPLTGYWKHEFATHRIVYRIYKDHRVVAVCTVGPRKQGDVEDIYNQLNAVARTGRLADQLATVLKNILPEKK
jgi:mRNA-degrading endonuclease RelE of RelBE toxin-antitoxin system